MRELRLYAITDRRWLRENENLESAVEEAIIGGATMIQLREKELGGEELLGLAAGVKRVCDRYEIPLIINDDVNLAREIDASGVHVGADDMSIAEARCILGDGKIIGATARSIAQAVNAQCRGADYIGCGAVFGTSTKGNAVDMPLEVLDEICSAVEIPVVAIGGIDRDNISSLREIPVAGVAVVSSVFAHYNKRLATAGLSDNLYGARIIHCITNPVTINGVANAILAVGGSPIMARHIDEMSQIQGNASALLVNLGATESYDAVRAAYARAIECHHPIVIDPVGVGGSSFRREFLKELFQMGSPACIRGNHGEIRAIYEDRDTMRGLDCDMTADSDVVRQLASRLGCVIVSSGAVDYISDGEDMEEVRAGSAMQKMVTGAGCMLSAVICTYMAISAGNRMHVAEYCCRLMGETAEIAASEARGTMSFLNGWIDALSVGVNKSNK